MAQTNGILAASTLGLPTCSRLQGLGKTLLLQTCAIETVTAIETKCGFQPYFSYLGKNCTIRIDGWSMHSFSDPFEKHNMLILCTIYAWEFIPNKTKGDWVKQGPNIHVPHLDLLARFDELQLNDFDYALKAHPAHNIIEMEQLNILNDLSGRTYETESRDLSAIIVSAQQDNNIGHVFSCDFHVFSFDTLKIMTLGVIGFVLLLLCVKLLIACNFISKAQQLAKKTGRDLD